MVMPAYFTPIPMPRKNCATCIASAGGRWVSRPAIEAAPPTISGPRIGAPKRPSFAPPHQPSAPQTSITRYWNKGVSAAGSPGGPVRLRPQIQVSRKGMAETITSTRVVWISDSARMSAPASSPKIAMSCSPPGMAE